MANRRGGSSMGGGGGSVRTGSSSSSKSVNPLSSLAKLYTQIKGMAVPNLAEGYNRSADSIIGAAGQAGDQGKAEFLAGGGGRTAGANLFGEQIKQQGMTGAGAEAARIRAQGALAQAEAVRQQRADIQNLLALIEQIRASRQQTSWSQSQSQQSGSPTGGGGGGGFRVIDTPSPWDRQREFDKLAEQQWGQYYWQNPAYASGYEAAGKEP